MLLQGPVGPFFSRLAADLRAVPYDLAVMVLAGGFTLRGVMVNAGQLSQIVPVAGLGHDLLRHHDGQRGVGLAEHIEQQGEGLLQHQAEGGGAGASAAGRPAPDDWEPVSSGRNKVRRSVT